MEAQKSRNVFLILFINPVAENSVLEVKIKVDILFVSLFFQVRSGLVPVNEHLNEQNSMIF